MNACVEWTNAWGGRFAGFALAMLLQSVVLITLLFALDLALRKRVRATIRYAVWMLALVKLALPPSLALPTGAAYWLPVKTAERVLAPLPAPAMTPSRPAAGGDIVVNNTEFKAADMAKRAVTLPVYSPKVTWQGEVFVVWLVVGCGMGIWVVGRWRMVAGVIRRSAEAPEAARVAMEACRRQWGIRRTIRVRCAAIGSPAICGVWRPVVLIPPRLAEHLDCSEMRSVLLHELAHYRRGDLWVNLAQIFLQVIYWYNPLLWLANAAIRRAREQAVDEMVLVEMGADAQAYPATLLLWRNWGWGGLRQRWE